VKTLDLPGSLNRKLFKITVNADICKRTTTIAVSFESLKRFVLFFLKKDSEV